VNYWVVVELDVHVGDGGADDPGSDERFAEVAWSWLADGARLLDAELVDELMAATTPPPHQEPWEGGPWGPPGAAFGLIRVMWPRDPASPVLSHATKPAAASAWRWLRRKLRERPFATMVEVRRLNDNGYPASLNDLAERVFRVLAPLLRPGLPTPPPPDSRGHEPYLIVYEDAATAARTA
jgi:hypothetical protein